MILIISKGKQTETYFQDNFPNVPLQDIKEQMEGLGYTCTLKRNQNSLQEA